jgi:hypothetical protein
MRIIRTVLILTGALFLLPSPPESETAVAENGPAPLEVFGSAVNAVSDAASFCVRQPGVCETAGYVAHRLEIKAKYSVKLIYEWASEASHDSAGQPTGQAAEASDAIVTGSTTDVAARQEAEESQSTLTIEDLIPEWRGPAPRQG